MDVVPTSNVRLRAPFALICFLRFPTTWPLVRFTTPVEVMVTVVAPVVMFPAVSTSPPATRNPVLSWTPLGLSIVRFSNVTGANPVTICVAGPSNTTVLVPALKFEVWLAKSPLKWCVEAPASNELDGPKLESPSTVIGPRAVAEAASRTAKSPATCTAPADIVLAPLVVRTRWP